MFPKRKIFSLALSTLFLLGSTSACKKSDSASSGNALVPGSSSATISNSESANNSASTTNSAENPGSANTTSASSENQTAPPPTSTLPADIPSDAEVLSATFLGVMDYGEPETTKENAAKFRYRFEVNGAVRILSIDNSKTDDQGNVLYPIQNQLKEGYPFTVYVKEDTVIAVVEQIPGESPDAPDSRTPAPYEPVVSGIPGKHTVENFIKTALMPVGTTLYVFGGGWDWQDTGSSIQSRTIGVSDDWVRFFREHDVNYTFREVDGDKEKADPTHSYYPYGGFNEYYYAGLDCSGFVGWTVYNTMETESGKDGFVGYATQMAKRFGDEYGWGTFTLQADPKITGEKLLPGDIISTKGHVWISLGTCDDGSILIVHSTNGKSRTGQPGCGVTLGAVGESKDCQAYILADKYMSLYFPEWYERYEVPLSSPDRYFQMDGEKTGRFSWNTTSGATLTDEEGIRQKSPKEILKICFEG